jgi:hypothetical protein
MDNKASIRAGSRASLRSFVMPAVRREAEEEWGSQHWIKSKIRQRQP